MLNALKRTTSLLFIGLSVLILLIEQYEKDQVAFIPGLIQVALYVLFTVTIIYILSKSLFEIFLRKKFTSLIPLGLGLLLIPILDLTRTYIRNDGFHDETLKAFYNGDLNGIGITLFEDSTYRLSNLGPFGGDVTRGRYKWKEDTLILNTLNSSHLNSGKFVIKTLNNAQYLEPVVPKQGFKPKLWISKDDSHTE